MTETVTVPIFGLPVWKVTDEELCTLVQGWAKQREGHWIVTLNLDYVARFQREPEFYELVRKADVFTADGMPILKACQKLDPRFKGVQRTTGADLTPKLLPMLDPLDTAIIGGKDPKEALRKLGLDPTRYFIFDGKVELTPQWAENMSKQIGDRGAIFVALGTPKQDQMIGLLRPFLPNAVFIAVGGSFEMIAGITRRAPSWMQKSGLEWLYRLAIEPKRLWKRYLVEYPPGAVALKNYVKTALRTSASKLPPL